MSKTQSLILFFVAVAALTFAMPASAQSGSIGVSSVSCPADFNTLGNANLFWSTDSMVQDTVVIWVYAYSTGIAPDASNVWASAHSGSGSAPWLQKGHSYVFVLYDSSGPAPDYTPGRFLNSVSIQCQ